MLPCIVEELPKAVIRGLCNKGEELDREYHLSMDEATGDIVYFGIGLSSIRYVDPLEYRIYPQFCCCRYDHTQQLWNLSTPNSDINLISYASYNSLGKCAAKVY